MMKALWVLLALVVLASFAQAQSPGITMSSRIEVGHGTVPTARRVVGPLTPRTTWVAPYTYRVFINDTLMGGGTSANPVLVVVIHRSFPLGAKVRLVAKPLMPARDSLYRTIAITNRFTFLDSVVCDGTVVRYLHNNREVLFRNTRGILESQTCGP